MTDVEIRRSARRKRTVRAYREGDRTIVLMPAHLSKAVEDEHVRSLVARLDRREQKVRPSDDELLSRASTLSKTFLDGEAVPAGGMGIAKQLKDEIFQCPPVVVLTGRPQDAWLATWSRAEAAVSHPIEPIRLAEAVIGLARGILQPG